MKGCLLPDGMLIVRGFKGLDQETAMQREPTVTQMGRITTRRSAE